MLSPKEREELVISRLGELLNEQGFGFAINKGSLSWKNDHVSVKIKPRGSKWSTADCSIRWLTMGVFSKALRASARAGAPFLKGSCGPFISLDRLVYWDIRHPDSCTGGTFELTDRHSCEQAAEQIALYFREFWDVHVSPWLNPERTIQYLSTRTKATRIARLFDPDSPKIGTVEFGVLIDELIASTWNDNHELLGKLLLATNRYDELRRLCWYCDAYADSNRPDAGRMARLDWLIRWLDEHDSDSIE